MKTSNKTITRFNMDFQEIKSLTMKDSNKSRSEHENNNSLRGFGDDKNDGHIGQSIYADCSYIYSLYNIKFKQKGLLKNYVAIFDYNGNYIRTLNLPSNTNNFELEELYYYNGTFYVAGTYEKNSITKFSIFKLNIKNTNKFDISYLDLTSDHNSYQTVTTGDENHTTRLLNINSSSDAKRTLIGYKAYRDYNNTWLVTVNEESIWLSSKEINQAKKEGKQVKYKLYKPTGSVYHTVKGGNSVLMIAQWK